jgi:UTP--glucose-1-phosphate uridylyltransferase
MGYTHLSFEEIEKSIIARMKAAGLHPIVLDDFRAKVRRVYDGETGLIDFADICDLKQEEIFDLHTIPAVDIKDAGIKKLVEQTVIIKLNGGLGTSMGLAGPKTLLPVRDGMNFLDIILNQIQILRRKSGTSIPLLFMNSFSTDEATRKHSGIAELNGDLPSTFVQNRVPRLDAATLLPVGDGSNPEDWCPPGHGDIFTALQVSGVLEQLLSRGIRYAFLSNGDNLGASFHPGILSEFVRRKLQFLSEVTPKTAADIKGGVLFRHAKTGRIQLLETAQVPPASKKDFENTERFSDFNINNLWIDLIALRDRMSEGPLDLSLIVNPKETRGIKVLQLECAMGAAIGEFERTAVVRVPRSRFAPVKNCSDLLVRRSDACMIDDNGALVLHPDRKGEEPLIILDDAYKKIQEFERLVPVVPSLLKCRRLTVKGAVIFDAPITLEGDVTIENPLSIPVSITRAVLHSNG